MPSVVNLSGAAYSFVPFNSHIPGAKCCAVSLYDFDPLGVNYSLDLTSTVQGAQLQFGIQSVYLDASQMNGGQLSFSVAGGQTFTIDGGQQAYFPITVQGQNIFNIVATSNGETYITNPKVVIIFYNVPFTTQVWNANVNSAKDVSSIKNGVMVFNNASGTSQTVSLINSSGNPGESGIVTGWSVKLMPCSISTVIAVNMFLTFSSQAVDIEGYVVGPEPVYCPPMSKTGLNMAMAVPGSPINISLFVTLSSAIPVGQVLEIYYNIWGSFT